MKCTRTYTKPESPLKRAARIEAAKDAVIQAAEAWRDCSEGIYYRVENALVAAIDELRRARK